MSKTVERLAWPLAVSVALHLGLAGLFSPETAERLPRRMKATTLTVVLPGKAQAGPARAASPKSPAQPSTPTSPGAADVEGKLTQKARFLVTPDLTALEEIPVTFSGSLNIRLHVTALGTVERATVTRGDPVPKELLDGLLKRLEQARLSPAQAGAEAVASTVDLVIRYEPGAAPLNLDQ